ncbi:efflux RND transporter periplasmic adaptor subunit [Brassicibacter mesophilus]|uniref:efflux RND transporter periplasmic adaptor subunit n=1 Tax=Brassicibacter mesophilus TaxID=745119 RepID=UPI003D263C1E
MYELEDDKKVELRKRKILRAGQIFFIIIIILTFTSKSIHNLTLPKVNAENVKSGSLTKEIVGKGIVGAKERIEYYTSFSVPVKDVKVSVGDTVKNGDILLILDKEPLVSDLEKKKIELKELMLKYEKTLLENLENTLHTYEQKVEELQVDLLKSEKELTIYTQLYNEGAASKNDLDDKKSEYELAKMKHENAKNEVEIQREKAKKDKENHEKQIELMELNISSTQMEIDELEKKTDKATVTAPTDGVIKELNYKKGMVVNNSSPLYILDSSNKGFEIEVTLNNADCEYLQPGDEGQVFVKNEDNSVIDGKIETIKRADNKDKRAVVVELDSVDLAGGESGELYIKKPIGSYEFLIPRQALREDDEGKFVYILQEKEGPLGREYYAMRKNVTVGDSDNRFIGIISGLIGDERIIVRSSKFLDDGSQVVVE